MTAKPALESAAARAPLRDPSVVMRLRRLGAMHQSRLSFMRALTRAMNRDRWTFSRPVFEIGDSGVGRAVYVAQGPERAYSLVCFAHDLPDGMRSDRVIAEAWDATFALYDGVPDVGELDRLEREVPVQEAGRVSARELTLSRANRSARLWNEVVADLAAGRQPAASRLEGVGYLMRTTAVYGSGKFGAADRDSYAGRPELEPPFQAEMLTVYLIRAFARDMVESEASRLGGSSAARLDPELARGLGIGNSTGLGMAPFLVNHPRLFGNWIAAREEALARVRSLESAGEAEIETFRDRLARSAVLVSTWRTAHELQRDRVAELERDVARVAERVEAGGLGGSFPWDGLLRWSEDGLGLEAQELVASLILEPYPELVDGLAAGMSHDGAETGPVDGAMKVARAREALERAYGWAREIDWSARESRARVWYVSAEKLEPRLGERFEEDLDDYEQPLAPGRDAVLAMDALEAWDGGETVAEFLLANPGHRGAIRRAQFSEKAPYAEIRDNTIGADMLPIDLLRAKLSFFGATRFDPQSDRWVRICMYAGAPYPEELADGNADDWAYPLIPPDWPGRGRGQAVARAAAAAG